MPTVTRKGFAIYYETSGPAGGRPLVTVTGMGEQIGSGEFSDEQCAVFADRGFRIVRIDGRDNGLSTPDVEPPAVEIGKAIGELFQGVTSAPYTLHDMADDVAAVLDDLAIPRAHVIGASLGGFIARWVAIRHPQRVASLTVVMSGCGAGAGDDGPQLGDGGAVTVTELALRRPLDEAIDFYVETWRWLWGSTYPFEEAWVRERAEYAHHRAYRPEGITRNLLAAIQTADLWKSQSEIACPTMVMHGEQDPSFLVAHGHATAARIPASEKWIEPGMGHVMHRQLWGAMAERLSALAIRAEA